MPEDVKQWLEGLGLGKYADSFADNDVGFDVLSDLNRDDLKELGVSLGDMKRILRAIEIFSTDRLDGEAEAGAPNAQPEPTGEAERRQLTVMFSDLAGSTALSHQLDPEDLREINRAYQDACKAAIERYDGYVARYMGDGVMAYFGYPRAHEDDAERAVRAGLELIEAIESNNDFVKGRHGIELAVRIGIATGPVIVGDLIGEGASQESAVVGETPNLAARLQGLATANSVVVGPLTYQLSSARFEWEDLGAHEIKGIPGSVQVRRVKAMADLVSRYAASHRGVEATLIGRDEEVDLLCCRWKSAKRAEGQVVLLSGEPGIGKSRLCETLQQQVSDESRLVVRFQCSPFHGASALYPILSYVERSSGFESTDSLATKLEKLQSFVRCSDSALDGSELALLAKLLSVPTRDRHRDLVLNEEQQKERTRSLLMKHFRVMQERSPVLMLIEDVHWADPSTLETLNLLVDSIEPWRILMLITFRPDFRAPWIGNARVSHMALNRLNRRQSEQMVHEVSRAYGLSARMEKEIVARTDGIPLFIEELTETVASIKETGADSVASSKTIPTTLQDSLMARLDRLPAGKIVAQTGAAIGREFTHELLKAVWKGSDAELSRGIDEIIESGVVSRRGAAPFETYTFRHALLQDAAYANLLRTHRKSLHRRIADALTVHAPQHPSVISFHWERAEHFENALRCRREAAKKSLEQFAHWEARLHFQANLDLLERLPETDSFDRHHLDTVVLGVQSECLSGELFLRHVDRAIKTASNSRDFSSGALIKAAKGEEAEDEDLLSQAAKEAATIDDKKTQARIATIYSGYLGMHGRFEDSYPHTARAIETYGELGEIVRQGMAMASSGRCYTARSGRFDDSLAYVRRARAIAEQTGDRVLQAWLGMEAEPYMYQGLWEECTAAAERCLPTAYETEIFYIALWMAAWAAISYVKLGRVEDAARVLEKARTDAEPQVEWDAPKVYFTAAMSSLDLAQGDITRARLSALRAVELAGSILLEQGVAHRAAGQSMHASGARVEADGHFRSSIEALSQIQSKPEFAQSLLAFGRFKQEEAGPEGERLVREALSIFEEIGAIGWVKEAQGAFNRCSSS